MNKLGKYDVTETEKGSLIVTDGAGNTRNVSAPKGDSTIINGAWYINQLPNNIVLELTDGSLTKVFMTPFRQLTSKDFSDYKGYHPRKCKGQPLPDYLYRFYGLTRNDESLSEVIRVRVSPSDLEKLETVAKNDDKTVSEFLRDYIRSL